MRLFYIMKINLIFMKAKKERKADRERERDAQRQRELTTCVLLITEVGIKSYLKKQLMFAQSKRTASRIIIFLNQMAIL